MALGAFEEEVRMQISAQRQVRRLSEEHEHRKRVERERARERDPLGMGGLEDFDATRDGLYPVARCERLLPLSNLQLAYNLLTTCLQLVYNLLTTYLQLNSNLITTCSQLADILLTMCLQLAYNVLTTCLQLAYNPSAPGSPRG